MPTIEPWNTSVNKNNYPIPVEIDEHGFLLKELPRSPVIFYPHPSEFKTSPDRKAAEEFFITEHLRTNLHKGDLVILRRRMSEDWWSEFEKDCSNIGCKLLYNYADQKKLLPSSIEAMSCFVDGMVFHGDSTKPPTVDDGLRVYATIAENLPYIYSPFSLECFPKESYRKLKWILWGRFRVTYN